MTAPPRPTPPADDAAARASIRAYAEQVIRGDTLADKLRPPPDLVELGDRELPLIFHAPGRPRELPIVPGRAGRVPPIVGMRDRGQRIRILHALANHELQAVELFAWALLAFPQAPEAFRRGLVAILADEQRHLGLYLDRLRAHGAAFGDHPVTGHFWNKLEHYRTPLRFCCAMGLTFENANLDFALEYAQAARAAGDPATAEVLQTVHDEEISHVRFGWVWMRKLGGQEEPWQTYVSHLEWPLSPSRARGKTFAAEARRRAGIDEDFIAKLEAAPALQPSGARR
ncbi:MAG TPA: DUF455 family protein [Kofleriaceae bacterium]|nr:DUF455 family protein [Kofleriaceae bacterium]